MSSPEGGELAFASTRTVPFFFFFFTPLTFRHLLLYNVRYRSFEILSAYSETTAFNCERMRPCMREDANIASSMHLLQNYETFWNFFFSLSISFYLSRWIYSVEDYSVTFRIIYRINKFTPDYVVPVVDSQRKRRWSRMFDARIDASRDFALSYIHINLKQMKNIPRTTERNRTGKWNQSAVTVEQKWLTRVHTR